MEPFRVDIPDEELSDLQARLKRTRWADDFANEGWQYGTNTAYLKELVAYWIDGYDWRKHERAMNAYPQFSTEIVRKTGINFWRTSGIWVELMERLGYLRFAAHGADWGALITADLGTATPIA